MSFDSMWSDLLAIGRNPASGGYNRFAWTSVDAQLREWFAAMARQRGLALTTDRAGNQWAWWGDPDTSGPGLVLGSHLDSVPDGGAYDGPLGVVSAFAAVDAVRSRGFSPATPIGIVNFGDEEGARFGIACAGSRLITGALDADRARALTDRDGTSLAEAMSTSGHDPGQLGPDAETLGRIGRFVELHVEQGRHLVDRAAALGVCSSIWPHGRFRIELSGQANHAGTTQLADRDDPMLRLASVISATREQAALRGCVGTIGKVAVEPNAVNAIPSKVTAWLDARGSDEAAVRDLAEHVARSVEATAVTESFTETTAFDTDLATRISHRLDDAPLMPTAAGHDAGILATYGIPAAMIFVRNPDGISHSPAEHAEHDDCLAGIAALASVIEDLAS